MRRKYKIPIRDKRIFGDDKTVNCLRTKGEFDFNINIGGCRI